MKGRTYREENYSKAFDWVPIDHHQIDLLVLDDKNCRVPLKRPPVVFATALGAEVEGTHTQRTTNLETGEQ